MLGLGGRDLGVDLAPDHARPVGERRRDERFQRGAHLVAILDRRALGGGVAARARHLGAIRCGSHARAGTAAGDRAAIPVRAIRRSLPRGLERGVRVAPQDRGLGRGDPIRRRELRLDGPAVDHPASSVEKVSARGSPCADEQRQPAGQAVASQRESRRHAGDAVLGQPVRLGPFTEVVRIRHPVRTNEAAIRPIDPDVIGHRDALEDGLEGSPDVAAVPRDSPG